MILIAGTIFLQDISAQLAMDARNIADHMNVQNVKLFGIPAAVLFVISGSIFQSMWY